MSGAVPLPRDLSAFEIEASFNFSDAERRVIEDRHGAALKFASALQIGGRPGTLCQGFEKCARPGLRWPVKAERLIEARAETRFPVTTMPLPSLLRLTRRDAR